MFEDMQEKLQSLDLKEILGYAIASEEAANGFYLVIVRVFDPNELVKNKFESIARDEKLHAKALLNLYKDTFGDENYPVPEGLPPFESVAEVEKLESLIETLVIAMQNEDNAYQIYTHLAKTHPENRKLFKYLAQTEMGHYEILKQEKGFFDEEVSEEP